MTAKTQSQLEKLFRKYVDCEGEEAIHISELKSSSQSITSDDLISDLKSIRDESFGNTVVHWAAVNGHLEILKWVFIAFNSKEMFCLAMRLKNKRQATPLHWAAKNGHLDTIQFVIANIPATEIVNVLTEQDKLQKTSIHWAAGNGRVELLEYMLGKIPDEQRTSVLKQQDTFGKAAIHYAAMKGHRLSIRSILSHLPAEERANTLMLQDKQGETPLHKAAENGQVDTIRHLLENIPRQDLQTLLDILNHDKKLPKNVVSIFFSFFLLLARDLVGVLSLAKFLKGLVSKLLI